MQPRPNNRSLTCPIAFLFLSLLTVATRALGVQASDDHFLVYILDTSLTVAHDDLLENDQDTEYGSVSAQTDPRHGTVTWTESTVSYFPDATFWAVGSDSLTYRVETSQGSSTATVYWVAERPEKASSPVMLNFELANDPFALQHSGLSILQGSGAILGNGSLQVNVSPQDPSAFGTVPVPIADRSGSTNGGDIEICLVGGSGGEGPFTESPGDQGYVVLLGQETDTTPEDAILRVGVTENGDYFLEIKEVNAQGGTTWHRSTGLSRNHHVSRFEVTYQQANQSFAAILRTEGLAVRIDAVPFYAAPPTHFHLGYFQPAGGGGSASILLDQVRVQRHAEDTRPLAALLDPLQLADGFEDSTTNAWTASYGSGLILDLAASLTGSVGLGVSSLSGGPSFVSFQPQVGEDLLDELSAELKVDLASFELDPTYQLTLAAIRSASDPLFGDPTYQVRVRNNAGSLGVKAFFRADPQTWLPLTTGGWLPINGSNVLRLQVGKGDGPNTFNGWARLWANGQIVQELLHLDNYDLPLRTVHFGAKNFNSQEASGTLLFDDLSVTR